MIRRLYVWLLGRHPRAFRERYAGEMLWIFDQERARGGPRLLADAATSALRQWCFRLDTADPQAAAAGARPCASRCSTAIPAEDRVRRRWPKAQWSRWR